MGKDYLKDYQEQGFAVVRGVFDRADVRELAAAFDRVHARGMSHRTSFRHQNVLFRIAQDAEAGRILRMVQWPSYFDEVLARYRVDPRMLAILEPLLGRDLKQIINQMHWKRPGARNVEFGYHQDLRFRRPRAAYRSPETSYVQTGIAIDPHRAENGAMTVIPGTHRLGELAAVADGQVMNRPISDDDLVALGVDPAAKVDLVLEPGDVALWHLCLIHGSGPNTSKEDRRFYLNGYVKAANCERGEWAFRDGRPCALGEPVLVHYDDLYARPEPHYLD
jgi:ectoine hydroxylase-related dioxygenase (phytanoyl-CoA dioxygenase family)